MRPTTRPTPRRVEQYVYRVSVGDREYRVTLPERLPARNARQRLHDMLVGNELIESGGSPIYADVRQTGGRGNQDRFNSRPQNARLDIFRDDYLSRTFRGGAYVDSRDIRIALVR